METSHRYKNLGEITAKETNQDRMLKECCVTRAGFSLLLYFIIDYDLNNQMETINL